MNKLLKTFVLCLLLISCSDETNYNTIISTDKGEVFYNLETATTPEQQAQGLMNRDSIADNGGMIFVINPIRNITMWMKDTKIPLDIVYISPEAKIIKRFEESEEEFDVYELRNFIIIAALFSNNDFHHDNKTKGAIIDMIEIFE